MFLEINNIDDAVDEYGTLQDIVNLFPGLRVDNHTLDRPIPWRSIADRIHGRHLSLRDDYRVRWQDRSEAPQIDYTSWDISRIIVVPHRTIKRVVQDGLCSCVNSRYENEDVSALTGRTAHYDHDDVHRLYNILTGINQNRRIPIEYGHTNEREVDDFYVGESFNKIWESYTRRFLQDGFWLTSHKHRALRGDAESTAEALIYYVYFIIKDDEDNECAFNQAVLYPVREPNSTTAIKVELSDYLNQTRSAFYGHENYIKYNIYDKVLQNDYLYRSVRQYKECKVCYMQVNKNNTVYAIEMSGQSKTFYMFLVCKYPYNWV